MPTWVGMITDANTASGLEPLMSIDDLNRPPPGAFLVAV